MSQAETTAAPTAEKNAEFKCSCGRTFAHEISLKRHRWVTGHAEAEPEASAPAAVSATPAPVAEGPALLTTFSEPPLVVEAPLHDTYEVAMEMLLAKAREQQDYERRAQMQAGLDLFVEFFEWMGDLARQSCGYLGSLLHLAASKSLHGAIVLTRSLALLVGVLGILFGGLTAGRALANGRPAEAAPAGPVVRLAQPERELVGARQDAPERTVEDFYAALDHDDFQAAYANLSGDWKRQLPFAGFEQGYAGTSSLRCTVSDVDRLSAHSVEVEFSLQTIEAGQVRDYLGSYVLVETSHGWQLDSGRLNPR